MSFTVEVLSTGQIKEYRDQFVTIYRDAFRPPPYSKREQEVADFARSLPTHLEKRDFRMVAALAEKTGDPIGFAYGYQPTPDQLWYKEVARLGQPQLMTEWMANSYQLVEIAVAPSLQGIGVGGRLHDQLLSGLAYQRAVLATMAAETNAYWMYRKRGWVVLLGRIIFPGISRPYQIMGLNLSEF